MGINAKTISNVDQLLQELAQPVAGINVVVCKVPDRETNADLIKNLQEKMASL